jgi:hypothetical protein
VALCSGLASLINNHFGRRALLRGRLRLHAISATALIEENGPRRDLVRSIGVCAASALGTGRGGSRFALWSRLRSQGAWRAPCAITNEVLTSGHKCAQSRSASALNSRSLR